MPGHNLEPASAATQSSPSTLKTHVCSWPGCNKRFTRAEHLRRHALNHEHRGDTCQRCGVHFTRPDLLERHMIRHAKKDEEAGGPGLGILETRKRTRRGPDGTIITKPTKKQTRAARTRVAEPVSPNIARSDSSLAAVLPGQRLDCISDGSYNTQSQRNSACSIPHGSTDTNYGFQESLANVAPVSPPTSTHNSCASTDWEGPQVDACNAPENSDALIAPMVPGGPYEPHVEPIPGQFDAAEGSWLHQGTGLDFDHADFYGLDTATSFNMPFATTYNYNWLFDVPSLDDAFGPLDVSHTTDITNFSEPVPDVWLQQLQDGITDDSNQRANHIDQSGTPETYSNNLSSEPCSRSPPVSAANYTGSTVIHNSHNLPSNYISDSTPSSSVHLLDASVANWTAYDSSPEAASGLPQITQATRGDILLLVSRSQATAVEGNHIEPSSPLLSINSLQTYLDLFFTRFNTAYPLIHQSTFNPGRCDTLFLAAVLSMGATYSSIDAHQLAISLHNFLRNQLFCHVAFSSQPELWVLQTMVLIDCFGKLRAGQKQRDMAQLFHCVLIKLVRRSNCLITRTSPTTQRPDDLELAWREAMDAEQRKRLAMLCFMWDTQHAVLFSQSLCMSAFEIRSCLPCDAAVWEARNAEEWFEQSHREPAHNLFLSVLKGYVTPNTVKRPRHLNAWARLVLLHGLMSISSDLKRRDQTTLRPEAPDLVGAWKSRVSRSYDLWKADFDADCMNMKLNLASEPRRFLGLRIAAHVLYHAAQIALFVEILDLQIYAGAPHILGRVVTQADFERSQRAVRRWLLEDSNSAAKATRHAALILQDAIMNLNDWDDTEAIHYPWCLYLATLTCWAFHLSPASTSSTSASDAGMDDPNSVHSGTSARICNPMNARNEMTTLVIGMTACNTLEELSALAGKFDTAGLTSVMAQQLSGARWEVVRDATNVLTNLGNRNYCRSHN